MCDALATAERTGSSPHRLAFGEVRRHLGSLDSRSTQSLPAVCVQLYYYYIRFPEDSKALKIFVGAQFVCSWDKKLTCSIKVAILWIVDTVHQALIFRNRTYGSLVNPNSRVSNEQQYTFVSFFYLGMMSDWNPS